MKPYYTPKSHFARKNRILIDALALDIELVDAGNVVDIELEIFATNPLMKVPTLVDDEQVIFESDYIAEYIVRKFNVDDQFKVLTIDVDQLNTRAVMNGVMTAEVELIMAERTGIDTQTHSRFDKLRAMVEHGLDWLEDHAELFSGQPTYADFHLVSLWDHLVLYKMFALNYSQLQSRIKQLSELTYVMESSPL